MTATPGELRDRGHHGYTVFLFESDSGRYDEFLSMLAALGAEVPGLEVMLIASRTAWDAILLVAQTLADQDTGRPVIVVEGSDSFDRLMTEHGDGTIWPHAGKVYHQTGLKEVAAFKCRC